MIVPAYNEAAGIWPTLWTLAHQQHRDFDLIVVDNNSSDATAQVVTRAIERWSGRDGRGTWRLVAEPQKGTGAAADTGMRAAIAAGATLLARTDADCLPHPDWTARIRSAFSRHRLIAGRILPRTDDCDLSGFATFLLTAAVDVASLYGRFRPSNQDPAYLGPYLMTPGANMAITAELYEAAGGFPRSRIEELHEDRVLVNAVRRLTANYATYPDIIVRASARRAQAWGLVRTLGWYADHRYLPADVDVR